LHREDQELLWALDACFMTQVADVGTGGAGGYFELDGDLLDRLAPAHERQDDAVMAAESYFKPIEGSESFPVGPAAVLDRDRGPLLDSHRAVCFRPRCLQTSILLISYHFAFN
jgi:hypothetical protein